MLQRLLVALVQINAGNAFENLLNKTCQIIYSLYRAKKKKKKNNKKVYINIYITNSIKL